MPVAITELESFKLFEDLNDVQCALIAAQFSSIKYLPNQLIYETGDGPGDVYFVKSGTLVARRFSTDGKEVHYADYGPGEYFGIIGAISQKNRMTNIEAVTPCHLLKMSGADFRVLVEKVPQLNMRFLKAIIERNRSFADRIFEYSTMPVAARVRREILRLAMAHHRDDLPIILKPAPSHYEIAARTSTHREAVSRELGKLNSLNIIQTGRREMRVTDIAQLEKLVAQDSKSVLGKT